MSPMFEMDGLQPVSKTFTFTERSKLPRSALMMMMMISNAILLFLLSCKPQRQTIVVLINLTTDLPTGKRFLEETFASRDNS